MKRIVVILVLSLLAQSQIFAQESGKLYKDNLIEFYPVSLIDRGVGVGFSYERMLDADQKISFIMPVDIIFPSSFVGGDYYNSNGWYDEYSSYLYLNPGLVFYPAGLRKVNYGIGPNLMLAFGGGSQWVYTNQGVQQRETYNNFRMGIMINNYLLVNATDRIAIRLNVGMGLRYVNSYKLDSGITTNEGMNVTGQLKFSMGYRF